MTNQIINNLEMIDAEYIQFQIKEYDPHFERMVMERLGKSPEVARKMSQFMGLIKGKIPETSQEWEEFSLAWEDFCLALGYGVSHQI